MNGRPPFRPSRSLLADRRRRVADLALQRVSQQAIADKLGVRVQQVAHDLSILRAEWADRYRVAIDSLQAEQLEALDRDEVAARAALAKVASDEHLVRIKYHDLLLRYAERRAKLCGLDAPQKAEITGTIQVVRIADWRVEDDGDTIRRIAAEVVDSPPEAPHGGNGTDPASDLPPGP